MKVLCISMLWPNEKNRNSSTQIAQQISSRSDAGAEITLIAPYRGNKGKTIWLDEYQPMPERFLPLSYPAIPLVERFSQASFFLNAKILEIAIMRSIKKLGGIEKFDIVHIQGLGSSIILARAIKKRYGIPVVVTVHGQHPTLDRYKYNKTFAQKVGSCLSYFDRVVLVGKPLWNFVDCFELKEEKVAIVHNGHQAPDDDPNVTDEIKAKYSGKVIIVSVARLYKLKGTDLTIQALSKLHQRGVVDWHYIHVGEGPEKNILKKLVREHCLENNVTFAGHLPYKQAMSILAASDIFIMPSWLEAFGIVYVEAMARGKPVIGCWESGAEESVRDNIDGFLAERKNIEDIEVALGKLICEPSLREVMGKNGLERAKQFTWRHNSEAYLEMYRSLIVENDHRTN